MQRMGWRVLALVAVLMGAAFGAAAQVRWGGGVYFGYAPVYVQPHYVQPHYAPPPMASEGCYAGPYVCPLDGPAHVGAPCACATAQGQAWGRAR